MDEGCRAVAEAKADNSHSMFPDRRRLLRRRSGDRLAGLNETGWQVTTAPGRVFSETNEKVWMFDNEIDWVMRI
jgi:hypothetical protein